MIEDQYGVRYWIHKQAENPFFTGPHGFLISYLDFERHKKCIEFNKEIGIEYKGIWFTTGWEGDNFICPD